MKFGKLKIGTVFIVDGEKHVKTSPMIARCEKTGAQKFVRRSVEVEAFDSKEATKAALNKRSLSQTEVLDAFSEFYRQCEQCLQKFAPEADKQLVHSVQTHLAEAKQRFLAKIN
ncbi:MAG: hypothetical protein PVF82_04570 [Gammaproteobacteria bacterium]|jgi:hypothetical protein